MKIAYFSYLPDIKGRAAGSANKAIEFIGALNQIGHEAKIFWRGNQSVPASEKQPTIKQRLRAALKKHLAKYVHEPKILLSNLKHLIQENKIIRDYNPDVVFTRLSLYSFSTLLLAKFYRKAFVIEADCPPIYENNTFYGKHYFHLSRIAEFIERKNLMRADAIIVLSTILRNYFIEQGIPAEKMFVIPNGADPDKFSPQPKNKKLMQELGMNKKSMIVGWTGSLAGSWAGLANLIEMAKNVVKQREGVDFIFVGGGANLDNFKHEFSGEIYKNRIFLPGTVAFDEVPHYMSLMDIVIAPYPKLEFWYPSSMKIFEYMACGKAVVASGVGQIPEIIQNEENGLLFDADDGSDLTRKVLYLIDRPELQKRLAGKARQTLLEKYTWKGHGQKISDIFNGILGREPKVVANDKQIQIEQELVG